MVAHLFKFPLQSAPFSVMLGALVFCRQLVDVDVAVCQSCCMCACVMCTIGGDHLSILWAYVAFNTYGQFVDYMYARFFLVPCNIKLSCR